MQLNKDMAEESTATIVVIGAGQAGLSAGYHLARRGFVSALTGISMDKTFVILDANPKPGGAWQHRWESLTMATVNGIFDPPDHPKPPIDPQEPSRIAVPEYFARFEQQTALPVLRPVHVVAVTRADDDPEGDLLVATNQGTWRTRAIINATGTWNNPLRPTYTGYETFAGRHLHTRDYIAADEFQGQRVAIVGGGISALQQLDEISRAATTFWYTRREPVFLDGDFRPEVEGREVIARVTADAEAGEPPRSIVSYTGLGWTPYAKAAKEQGGITVTGTQVTADPHIHLVGYGPSQSTVGANRAGRDAARILAKRSILDLGQARIN